MILASVDRPPIQEGPPLELPPLPPGRWVTYRLVGGKATHITVHDDLVDAVMAWLADADLIVRRLTQQDPAEPHVLRFDAVFP